MSKINVESIRAGDRVKVSLYDAWERILSRTTEEGDCWRSGHRHNRDGYVQVSVAGRLTMAHHVAYAVSTGEALESLRLQYREDWTQIDHDYRSGCRYRDCVNPAHLRKVSSRENSQAAKRRVTECPRGHLLTEGNLSAADVRRGRRSCLTCERGRGRVQAAKKYGRTLTLSEAVAGVLNDHPALRSAAMGEREVAA